MEEATWEDKAREREEISLTQQSEVKAAFEEHKRKSTFPRVNLTGENLQGKPPALRWKEPEAVETAVGTIQVEDLVEAGGSGVEKSSKKGKGKTTMRFDTQDIDAHFLEEPDHEAIDVIGDVIVQEDSQDSQISQISVHYNSQSSQEEPQLPEVSEGVRKFILEDTERIVAHATRRKKPVVEQNPPPDKWSLSSPDNIEHWKKVQEEKDRKAEEKVQRDAERAAAKIVQNPKCSSSKEKPPAPKPKQVKKEVKPKKKIYGEKKRKKKKFFITRKSVIRL